MGCGVGCRRGSDPTLLWLWRRPVVTAPIGPLAWELPCAMGVAQENGKKKDKKKIYGLWSSHCDAVERNLARNHEVVGSIPGRTKWVQDPAFS